MGTSVEKDLKTLRASKLMSTCPEYCTMMVELEKFHKENAKGRYENKELDLRPFLYDDGDTYEKPFYNILLKLLYEVASFQSSEKQHEDVSKVYEWFLSHKKLISEEDPNTKGTDDEMLDMNQNIEFPKLYLRPTSANAHCNGGSLEVADTKYPRERYSKSAPGSYDNKRSKTAKIYNPLNKISVSLKVVPLTAAANSNEKVNDDMNNQHSRFSRCKTAPSIAIQKANKSTTSLPSTFVLKPSNPISPPDPSPVSSPFSSPRPSRRISSHSARSSPVTRLLSSKHSPPRRIKTAKDFCDKTPLGSQLNLEIEQISLKTSARKNPVIQNEYYDSDIFETDGISYSNLTTDEEGELYQEQLKQLHQIARRKKEIEVMRNLEKDADYLNQEQGSLESLLVREHVQLLRDDNYARFQKHEKTSESTPYHAFSTLPTVDVYDVFDPLPVSAVNFRNENVRIESVVDMVQPVGEQMKYQRETRNGMSVWDTESVTTNHSFQRLHSALSLTGPTHGVSKKFDYQKVLNFAEPTLNPEMKANDYTVHFPHQSYREPTLKDFKVSGPVLPDSVRYQWTDDGFGNRTYLKKRSPAEVQTRASPRSTTPAARKDVAMVTGKRGLDKRTIASLMVIRHLGTNRRRESYGPDLNNYKCITENSVEPLASYKNEEETPQYNVEYLPFWKQLPQKKGLTIINIPDPTEDDLSISSSKAITASKEPCDNSKNTTCPSSTAQTIVNEMVSTLTPQRRTMGNFLDTSSLSIRARSISPETKCRPNHKYESRDFRSVPSPTPVHSRPTSAQRLNKETIPLAKFSVKDFSHFCCEDDVELLDDYKRQREIWAAINIQRIFRGHMARQYATSLKQADRERRRKAAVALQSTIRGYLARKKLMKQNLLNYKPRVRDLQWAKEYKEKLKEREAWRNRRNLGNVRQQNRQFEKQQEQMSGVTASDMIYGIFNPPKPTKAQMKAAAITIQRFFRGWFVRKSLKTVKARALKRTFSFNKFIKSYQDLVYRIQKRYNIETPNTALQFHELQEYVDRLFKYEIAFGKMAENGVLRYEDIVKYFAECGHDPSVKEIDDAIAMVTEGSPKGRNLTKSEAVEVIFQIYIPKGTGLTLADVRKSTWMNPLIDGQDVKKLLSKKDLKLTSLDKCLALVADSQTQRNEVKELLRSPDPQLMNVIEQTQENKSTRVSSAKSPGGGKLILPRGKYQPVTPSASKQNKKKRPVSCRSQR